MNSIIWGFVDIWLSYWYCGRALKFARALRFDSKLGRGAVILLSIHWPLAMFLVLIVRVSAGRRSPLFLDSRQEKRLRKRLRDGERDESRRAAERTWNEWNQRLTFVTKLAAEAEREKNWLDQERLAEQLEFLKATEPMGPNGVKESHPAPPRQINLDDSVPLTSPPERTRLTQPNRETDGFCNICNSYRSVLQFEKAGVCNVCSDGFYR